MATPNISLSKTERAMQAFNLIWKYRPELNGRYSETVASGLGALIRSASDSVSMHALDPRAVLLVSKPVELLTSEPESNEILDLADEDW
jgi:hypothetical protein